MSICRIIHFAVGRGCFLWPVHFLGTTVVAFALLNFVLQGQTCLLPQIHLDFLLLHSSLLWWKGPLFFGVSSRRSLGLHRTVQLQLLQRYWLGHRLGLMWYWMVCLRNEQRSFGCFEIAPSTAFWTLLLTMRATPFLLRDSCLQCRYNDHLN